MATMDNLAEKGSGAFFLKPEVASAMVALLRLQSPGRLLVIGADQSAIADDVESEVYEVTYASSSTSVERQLAEITSHAPFDGAVIIPQFGAGPLRIPLPDGWEAAKYFSEDVLIAHSAACLKPSGRLVAMVPYGLLTNYGRRAFRRDLLNHGLLAVLRVFPDMVFENVSQIALALIYIDKAAQGSIRPITFVDVANLADLPDRDYMNQLVHDPQAPAAPAQRAIIAQGLLSDDFRLDPQFYDPAYLRMQPPPGYSDVTLGEIADIRGGIGIYDPKQRFDQDPGGGTPYCQVRHIADGIGFWEDILWVKRHNASDDEPGWAKPGDVLVSVAGTIGRVAMVPPGFNQGVFFDTSIRRIRVKPDLAQPEQILAFLRSDVGKLQFRRLTSGTVIPQLTSPALASLRVFLPPAVPVESAVTVETAGEIQSQARLAAQVLRREVVDYLEQMSSSTADWQETVGGRLRGFLTTWLPKTLDETILLEYPAPIAITYRRYKASRHNSYEGLSRLVALVESCIYFAFHMLAADFCKQKLHETITLSSDAKSALRGDDSVDHRLKFIQEVLQAAHDKRVALFMPELATSQIVTVGDVFRENVRNPTAHTAPGAEPRVRLLIDQYWPQAEQLLESLRFLSGYTLCRIHGQFLHKGRWHYQADSYRGAEYDTFVSEVPMELPPGSDVVLLEAEREHLVVMNSSYETLDVFPFYQLHLSETTGFEPHLCFFKKGQNRESKLRGESVRSGVELDMPGYTDFRLLTRGSEADSA